MDHPRFEPIVRRPEDAHRRYNGGRLAELVFLVVDRWSLQRIDGRARGSRKREINALIALAFLAVCLVGGVATTRPGNLASRAAAGEPVIDEIGHAYVAGNDGLARSRYPPHFDIAPAYLP